MFFRSLAGHDETLLQHVVLEMGLTGHWQEAVKVPEAPTNGAIKQCPMAIVVVYHRPLEPRVAGEVVSWDGMT